MDRSKEFHLAPVVPFATPPKMMLRRYTTVIRVTSKSVYMAAPRTQSHGLVPGLDSDQWDLTCGW